MRTSEQWIWLVCLMVLGGCHKLLGDYTLDEGQDGGGCSGGSVQCVGNVLQRCNGRGTAWDNVSVCASEALCDAGQGVCLQPACAAGERQCQQAELVICSPTRDGWSPLDTCPSAALCSSESGTCTQEPCEPGAVQCNGATLRSCKDDRSGWNDLDTCASAALCNKEERTCDDGCGFGEHRCEGAVLQACNDTLTGWTTVKTCDSEALCDATSGTCGTAGCTTAGVFRCTAEGVLERCTDDLTAWAAQGACPSAAHCDAVHGACTDAPCTPGAYQCYGPTLEVCNADRTGWDDVVNCDTDGLCQETLAIGGATCVPPVCEVNQTQCVDGQPQICNAGRTGFRDNGAACLTVELCNAGSGTCATPVCVPNQTRCTAAQPEICNPGLTDFTENGPPCASAALCNPTTGTCGDQQCVAGQLRCDPAAPTHLQRCKDDLTDWEPEPCDVCDTPELCNASLGAMSCDATACQEPVCNAGEPRCGGSGTESGRALEMCNVGRTGYMPCQTCVTAELCNLSLGTSPFSCSPTACTPPSCSPSDRWCGGSGSLELHQCPASRINSEPIVVATCVTNGLCELTRRNGATTCVAPSCSPSDRWCGGSGSLELHQCPASRINSEPIVVATCVTNGLCELTLGNGATTCVAPSCALTDRWCGGSGNLGLHQCPASRINSEAILLDTCVTNGLCEQTRQGGRTTCDAPACSVGATRCGGTGSMTLQACRSDRTGFMDCDTCATAQLCTDSLGTTSCNSSACFTCRTGEARCNTAGNYETCRSDHTGFNVTSCMGNGCDATMGGCLPAGSGGTAGAGAGGTAGSAGSAGTSGTSGAGGS